MDLLGFGLKFLRFTEFGGPIHERPVQDLAFAVARFIQKGGSFFNYYMVGFSHQIVRKVFKFLQYQVVLKKIKFPCSLREIVPWRDEFWTLCWRTLHHNQL